VAIKSYVDSGTRDIAEGINSKAARAKLPVNLHEKAELICSAIAAASILQDLTLIRGWKLEKLTGNRLGQYSLRINKQYRICFTWTGKNAEDVEIVDYH
jgi:toxin HigB-1